MPVPRLSRRSVLTGAGLAVAGGIAGYLVAQNSDAADAKAPAAAANGYGPPKADAGSGRQVLAPLADIPAGGGIVTGGVVVTRDSSGHVHGFSATCTHQGCTVSSVTNGRITCPCHGSVFDARTGAVVNGPATRPLPAIDVLVRSGTVIRA